MAAHDAQLLKGVLTLLLLRLLADGESYGYELVNRVHDLGLPDVPDGSIYPALARMEKEGHVSSRLVPSDAGPARKYYRLSRKGEAVLAQRRRAWNELVALVDPVLSGTRER